MPLLFVFFKVLHMRPHNGHYVVGEAVGGKRNPNVDFNKKNRVTAAQFASKEAIANTPHSPRSNISISQNSQKSILSAQENSGKVSRSCSTTGEVVTLSKGELAKLHANYAGGQPT